MKIVEQKLNKIDKEELFKDWISDRNKDYISRFDDEKTRIDWKEAIEKGHGYSSYIYGDLKNATVEELARKAYSVANTRMSSLGLSGYKIRLSAEGLNFSDGKQIVVSTKILSDETLSPTERVDVLLGEVVHEAAHVLYTDSNVWVNSISYIPNNIFKSIFNIIEDEYIERSIGKEFPGYSNYILAIKKNILGKSAFENLKTSKDPISEIISAFLAFVRYPKFIKDEIVEKHGRLMLDIKDLFLGIKYPESTKESANLSVKVYDILKAYYESHEDLKPPPPKEITIECDPTMEDNEDDDKLDDLIDENTVVTLEGTKYEDDDPSDNEALSKAKEIIDNREVIERPEEENELEEEPEKEEEPDNGDAGSSSSSSSDESSNEDESDDSRPNNSTDTETSEGEGGEMDEDSNPGDKDESGGGTGEDGDGSGEEGPDMEDSSENSCSGSGEDIPEDGVSGDGSSSVSESSKNEDADDTSETTGGSSDDNSDRDSSSSSDSSDRSEELGESDSDSSEDEEDYSGDSGGDDKNFSSEESEDEEASTSTESSEEEEGSESEDHDSSDGEREDDYPEADTSELLEEEEESDNPFDDDDAANDAANDGVIDGVSDHGDPSSNLDEVPNKEGEEERGLEEVTRIEEELPKRDFEEDSDKIAAEINKEIDSSTDEDSTKVHEEAIELDEEIIMDIEGDTLGSPGNKDSIFIPVDQGQKDVYDRIKNKIKPFSRTLATQLTFDTFIKNTELRGLRNGKLDENRIVEASIGVDTVYNRTIDGVAKGGILGMLLDESGSMCSRESNGMRRCEIAQELAILFNEALQKTKLEYSIYGHTADYIRVDNKQKRISIEGLGKTYILVYKEGRKQKSKHVLSTVTSRSNNRDGDAIYATAKRMRQNSKDKNEPIYLIVVSDGLPQAFGYIDGVDHSRKMVELCLSELNVIVIGVGVHVSYSMRAIYGDNHVNFSEMRTFVKDVGKLIRKIVKKNYK